MPAAFSSLLPQNMDNHYYIYPEAFPLPLYHIANMLSKCLCIHINFFMIHAILWSYLIGMCWPTLANNPRDGSSWLYLL